MLRENPYATSLLGTLRLGDDEAAEKSVLTTLVQRGLSVDQSRASWLSRQRDLTCLRYGIRAEKTFPWPGASNLSVPLTDYAIRKYKPILFRLFTEPTPIVEFQGLDENALEVERRAEYGYDYYFKHIVDSMEPLAYLLDTMCHRGFCFLQVGWDYQTEYVTKIISVSKTFGPTPPTSAEEVINVLAKQYSLDLRDQRVAAALMRAAEKILAGATEVSLAFREVIQDRVAIWEREPVQVLAPLRTTDYRNADWIIIQHVLTLRKIEQLEADGFFIKGTADSIRRDLLAAQERRNASIRPGVDEVDGSKSQGLYQHRATEDERERIWGTEDEENILVWQVFHWFDYNRDGLAERVETFIHPKSFRKCRCSPYVGPSYRWPIVKFDFEKTSRRWHAPRGISQMTQDLQIETNAQHNARIDGMTLRNAPVYQINVLSGFRARNFRVAPGTVIHTPAGSTLQPLVQDRGAFPEQFQEENLLRSLAEHYVGIFDAAITSPASSTKGRTATEVSAIVQYTSSTSTMDAQLFQNSMKELHQMVWDLWMDLGPEEFFLPVMGLDPNDPQAQFVRIKKSEINKRFKLNPTGTVLNTNRALELANAREATTMYANDPTGFINARELRAWHLSALAPPRWARRIINSPEQAMELQTLRDAALALQQQPELMTAMQGAVPMDRPEQPTQEMGASSQYGAQGGQ